MNELTASAILSSSFALIRGAAGRVLIAFVAITAIGVADDLAQARGSNLTLVNAGVGFAMQYWLSGALMEQLELRSPPRRFWAMLGLCILTNLGIILGLVFLIVPGIILAVRWSISVPYLLGDEGLGVVQAIGTSWQETRERFWPILGAFVGIYAPLLGGMVIIGFVEALGGGIAGSVTLNALTAISVLLAWHAAVAIYAAGRPAHRLSDLFA